MHQGWIKLYRSIRSNEIFNDHQLLRLWLICLTEASHKEHDQLIGKQVVHLMPGQFVTGRFDIFELYNSGLKNSDKVKGEKTVYRWLEVLEKGGFLTIKKTTKYSVISITNWDKYQQNDQQMTNKRPTKDQQMTTNKNDKNVNKKDMSIQQAESFDSWWNLYGRKTGKVKCEAKFKQLLKEYEYAVIEEGTKRYLHYLNDLKAKGEFVPAQKNPLTFLNGEHFNDQYEQVSISSQTTPQALEFTLD